MSNEINWAEISAALRAPFAPEDVDFRPQGKPSSNGNVQVVAYVDARTVMARLDEACGPGSWNFTWEPVVVANGQVQIAKGRLTIHGVIREDVGEASNFDPSKGCVSDLVKRVAVQFGVGRYLYNIERTWVRANGDRLSDETIATLRAKLPGAKPVAQPTQRAFVATPRPLAPAPADDDEPATPEQQERLRKYREALGINDKSIAVADNLLRRSAAEGRISTYIAKYKESKQLQPATPPATTAGNGARHE